MTRPREPEDHAAPGLSEAARGVVRESADRRLDAHLARLLSDAEANPPERAANLASVAAELERLRDEVARATAEAAILRKRLAALAILLALAFVVIVVLVVMTVR